VARAIDILRSGIVRTMKLLGVASVRDLNRELVTIPREWV
jgi:isopentenyl diphosphate isomerase/L-lactate dehydrogenase-like FMN-dependent dehydrogenase